MRKKISEARRNRILSDAGKMGVSAAAKKNNVTKACIYNWVKRGKATPTPEKESVQDNPICTQSFSWISTRVFDLYERRIELGEQLNRVREQIDCVDRELAGERFKGMRGISLNETTPT